MSLGRGNEDEWLTMIPSRDYEKFVGASLTNNNRHAHVLKVKFREDGYPLFELNKDELYNTPFRDEIQKGIND